MRRRPVAAAVAAALALAACGADARAGRPGPTTVTPASDPAVTAVPASDQAAVTATRPSPTTEVVARPAAPPLPVPTGPPARFPPVTAPSLERAPGTPSAHGVVQTGVPPDAAAAPTYQRTPMGCADGTDAASLDRFFATQQGGAAGWDYPHVQALPGGRAAWFFQDAFVDHRGTVAALADARLVRNIAVIQDGRCFTLVHTGSLDRPEAFESGVGEIYGVRWWWPLGSQVRGDELDVVWVEMVGDVLFPRDGIGQPWFPAATWIGTYRTSDLSRLSFRKAPDSRVDPIYGYALDSDGHYTYLFGNTYQQDLRREGGLFVGHTAVAMYVARVPKGRLDLAPTYWDGTGWVADRARAAPISQRFGFENPMEPRRIAGRWVATTKVDGFLGDEIAVDVAPAAQGPWVEVARVPAPTRRGDARLATYHAYLMPWRTPDGGVVVSLSQNAGDAQWAPAPEPWMYRPSFLALPWPPSMPPPTTTSTTTTPPTTEAPTTTAPPEPAPTEPTTTVTPPPDPTPPNDAPTT